jgi:hypothetical protein
MKTILIILILYLLTNFSIFDIYTLDKPVEEDIKEIPEEKKQEVKQQLQKPETGIKENTTHVQISTKEEDKSIEITKNKVEKTAETKIIMMIPDELELEEPSVIPLTVNFVCTLFATTFFDPEEFQEYQEKFNLQIENKESLFKDYEVTQVTINFVDQETEDLIADCTSTGGSQEDIEFNAYRSYPNSMFDMHIGKIGKTSHYFFKIFFNFIPEEER